MDGSDSSTRKPVIRSKEIFTIILPHSRECFTVHVAPHRFVSLHLGVLCVHNNQPRHYITLIFVELHVHVHHRHMCIEQFGSILKDLLGGVKVIMQSYMLLVVWVIRIHNFMKFKVL